MTPLQREIDRRRRAIPGRNLPPGAGRIWGLALSGGGIRSATFCFGLLRALAARQLLLRFDLISTVSGGGYIGAMLGRLFSRAASASQVEEVAHAVANADTRWFTWWLRANARYLVPRGAKDRTFAIALYLRNLVGVHIELGLLALLLGVLLAGIDLLGWSALDAAAWRWPAAIFPALRHLPSWLPVVVGLALPPLTAAGFVVATAYWCVPWLARTANLTGGGAAVARTALLWIGLGGALIVTVFGWLVGALDAVPTDAGAVQRRIAVWVTLAIGVSWALAVPLAHQLLVQTPPALPEQQRADQVRSRLTKWLANCLRAGGVVLLAGAVDRLAWWLAFELDELIVTGVVLAVAASLTRTLMPLASARMVSSGTGRFALPLARLVGYALTLLLASWWASLVYQTALGAAFQRSPGYLAAAQVLLLIGVPAVVYLLVTGRNFDFLNLSSMHPFYRARLVRSYLGAANPRRFARGHPMGAIDALRNRLPAAPEMVPVDDVHADDDIALDAYAPQCFGAPVHLINTCVNQTRDPRGGLFNQDRRGLALTVASGGWMQVSRHGWGRLDGNAALTLGTWTAISGAAVAPGLGSRTRGGISALATFAGVRLGYWWDQATRSNAVVSGSPRLAKSLGLLRETFGVFRGTERPDWFLTDGGHFENTGAYALLAERAELIVLADCGADPDYSFGDLENLVRKARIDLQTEILFLRPKPPQAPRPSVPTPSPSPSPSPSRRWRVAVPPRPEPDPYRDAFDAFGSLDDLASSRSSACLALARVKYNASGTMPAREGLLIVVKPNLSAGLPVDLVNFKRENPEFPQQPTADQFFSEAQWESYFQLGSFIGGKLTAGLVRHLVRHHAEHFVEDERSPLELRRSAKAAAEAADDAKTAAAARLPARIGATAMNATIGLGAAATLGVSVWTALDSVRTTWARQTADERAALKELTELWARLPAPPASPEVVAAPLNQLASAVVRIADTLCPRDEAGWFQTSAVAAQIYDNTLTECERQPKLPACVTLLESATPGLQTRLPNCLKRAEGAGSTLSPRYGFYDWSRDATASAAHPCDPRAAERKALDDAYRSGRLTLQALRSGSATPPRPDMPPECGWPAPAAAPVGEAEPTPPPSPAPSPAPAPPTGPAPSPAPAPAPEPAPPPSPAPSPPAPSPAPPSPAASPALPVPPLAAAPALACRGKTVFVQIYGPQARDESRAWREPWRALGAAVPAIDDVYANARQSGRAKPLMVTRTTVRYHDEASRGCALALGPAVGQGGWIVEPLSARLKSTPGVIEVWVPPRRPAAAD